MDDDYDTAPFSEAERLAVELEGRRLAAGAQRVSEHVLFPPAAGPAADPAHESLAAEWLAAVRRVGRAWL